VVDKFFMPLASRAEHNFLGITVVLHPSLIDIVNKPPSIARHSLQYNVNVPISKTVRGEGTESSVSPTISTDDRSESYSVALRNED
jgi:hypothetical protein